MSWLGVWEVVIEGRCFVEMGEGSIGRLACFLGLGPRSQLMLCVDDYTGISVD